jgi:hypothetical protein
MRILNRRYLSVVAAIGMLLFFPHIPNEVASNALVPQLGTLVVAGGGNPMPEAIRDEFLELAKSAKGAEYGINVIVIPSASGAFFHPILEERGGQKKNLGLLVFSQFGEKRNHSSCSK